MVREDRPMSFLEHLEELRRRLLRAFVVFLIAFFVVFVVSVQPATVAGQRIFVPGFDPIHPMSFQLLVGMIEYLVPEGVNVTVLEPQEFFLQQMKVGIFLAVAIAMPAIVYQLAGFVAPALYAKERRLILRIAAPATVLFIAGVMFAYFLVLPFTFRFLYSLVPSDFTKLLRVESFLDFVLPFLLGFGLAFQLPIIMSGLSYLGVVDHAFWRRNWRYAVLAGFFFGALITPDGTGITMLLVAGPICALYGAGYAASWWQMRSRSKSS